MKSIKKLNLVNIIKDETGKRDEDFTLKTHRDGYGYYETTCVMPHHNDSSPSFVIRDLTKNGKGWEYKCFGCGERGDALKLLVKLGKFPTIDEAREYLGNKYKVFYPQQVTLEYFAEDKGFTEDFLRAQGCENDSRGVVIPFRGMDGKLIARKIRCKYTGKGKYYYDTEVEGGINNPIYGLDKLPFYDREETLYLTEGETDCLTIRQAGFQALGVPGSQAFNKQDAELFRDFKDVVLIRDNDAAGLLLVKHISEKVRSLRVITMHGVYKDVNQLWSEAYLDNMEGFKDALIGFTRVPATSEFFKKMVSYGTIKPINKEAWDLMAQLYSAEEIDFLAEEIAGIAKMGKKAIKAVAATAKKNAMDAIELDGLKIDDNCYIKTVNLGGLITDVTLTNFIVVVDSITVSEEMKTYNVHFVNQEGYPSATCALTSEILANSHKFMEQLYGKGNYVFLQPPTAKDYNEIVKLILDAKDVDVINEPQVIGAVGKGEWLFGNCGVDKDGNVVMADEDGVITLGEKKFRPISLNEDAANGDEEVIVSELPVFRKDEMSTDVKDYKRGLVSSARRSLGSLGAWTALGWVAATWFSNSIFSKYHDAHFFPFLFVHGKKGSGKSTFCKFLYQAFGFTNEAKPFGSTTPVAISRLMGYNSSIPVWVDDYRTDIKDIEQKNNMLLGFYNRQGRAVGTKTGFGIKSNQIRAVLLLSGEHKISDAAALSRCVEVTVSDTLRGSREDLSTLSKLSRLLPSYSLTILKKVNQETEVKKLFSAIKEVEERLLESVTDDRIAVNTAIFAGAFLYEFGDVLTSKERNEYLAYLGGSVTEEKKDQEESSMVHEFFTDLNYVFEKMGSEFTKRYAKVMSTGDTMQLALRVKECVIAVNETLKRQYQYSTIKSYIAIEKSIVASNKAVRFDRPAKATVFSYEEFKRCGDAYGSVAELINSYCSSEDTLEEGREY